MYVRVHCIGGKKTIFTKKKRIVTAGKTKKIVGKKIILLHA
jgi:hypothetical protein